jgi:hypothetical protein
MAPSGQVAGARPAGITRTGLVTGADGTGIRTTWTTRALLPRYEAYRKHQARLLLSLIPSEGVRALYRAARAAASEEGGVEDPMALLDEYVTARLPLPPFHLWCQDVRRNPHAHLDELWMGDALPDRSAPITVAVREDNLRGMACRAELRVYHTGEGWHGHLRFTRNGEERAWQTADVFREADVQTIVDRFHEFGWLTLEAFLRSILP